MEKLQEEFLMKKYFISNRVTLMKSEDDKFYENDKDSELVNNEGEDTFSFNDFVEKIKSEVLEFINDSYSNIVVLAGAGASVVFNDKKEIDSNFGKTVSMIAEDISERMNEDSSLYSLQELATMSNYNEPVLNSSNGKFNYNFNLENFLSNLLTYEQFMQHTSDQEKFINSKNKILDLIKKNTNYDFDYSKMKHAALVKVLSESVKKPNKLTIVTTNYDTLFEEAAESMDFTVIDGFTFSYNPHFDSDMFEWNLVKEVPNIKTKEREYKRNIIDLLKIHGSLTWEYSSDGKKVNRRNKNHVKNPIMVFPSSNKYMQSYENPYFELFTKFQELLRQKNTLLLTTGFSFADNHIAQMIIQAIKRNTGLAVLVSDYNIEQEHENWLELEDLRKNHFRIAFLKATLNEDLVNFLSNKRRSGYDYR